MLHLSPSIIDNTIGMIVGNNLGTITNSYYFNPYHLTNNASGVELSKDQLFDNSNYIGFDFTNTWEIKEGILLPILKNMNFIPLTSFNAPSTLDVNINATNDQFIVITKDPLTNLRNNYLFNSSNESIVKVTTNGQIIPVSLGTATVSVYSIELNTTKDIVLTVINVVKGDLNGDKNVTTTDLVILRRYLAGIENLSDDLLKNADINADAIISLTDLVKLRRFLAGLEDL
jgi:hypothetical protein